MRTRPLGTTGIRVSELGFGCARLGGIFYTGPRRDVIRLVQEAVYAGITFFDTSDLYSQGESESLLGEALAGHRHEIVIASKVGYVLPARRRAASRLKPLLRPVIRTLGLRRGGLARRAGGALGQDFSPRYIEAAVDASLRRLRTDRLDLYQLHSPPAEILRRGEFIAPLERLQRAGKIRFFGVSCETTADAELCLSYPALASLQLRTSLLAQDAATTLIPSAAQRGLGVIVRECLAGGVLTDGPSPLPAGSERFASRIAHYRAIAARHGRSLPSLALHWALAVPGVSVALAGIRSEAHLRANLDALEERDISEAERAEIAAASL